MRDREMEDNESWVLIVESVDTRQSEGWMGPLGCAQKIEKRLKTESERREEKYVLTLNTKITHIPPFSVRSGSNRGSYVKNRNRTGSNGF